LHWYWTPLAVATGGKAGDVPKIGEAPVRAVEAPPAAGKALGYTPTTPPQESLVAPLQSSAGAAAQLALANAMLEEELSYLYTLKDDVEDTLGDPVDILDRIRDELYERIQIKEMALWDL